MSQWNRAPRAGIVGVRAPRIGSPDMIARRIVRLARHAPHIALAVQLALLIAGDPSTAASGGGDFPYRRW